MPHDPTIEILPSLEHTGVGSRRDVYGGGIVLVLDQHRENGRRPGVGAVEDARERRVDAFLRHKVIVEEFPVRQNGGFFQHSGGQFVEESVLVQISFPEVAVVDAVLEIVATHGAHVASEFRLVQHSGEREINYNMKKC